jgi:alpha-amylase
MWVRSTLLTWIKDLVKKYKIDGIRIDAVPHVPKDFWAQFRQAAGVYGIGEVFRPNVSYVADYTNYMDAVFNYPLQMTLVKVFGE